MVVSDINCEEMAESQNTPSSQDGTLSVANTKVSDGIVNKMFLIIYTDEGLAHTNERIKTFNNLSLKFVSSNIFTSFHPGASYCQVFLLSQGWSVSDRILDLVAPRFSTGRMHHENSTEIHFAAICPYCLFHSLWSCFRPSQ